MKLLSHLLTDDPASPRLTVYNESTGARLDFSAQTLDNWVAKIANFLEEELEIDEAISIQLPPTWQAAVIALGSLAAGPRYSFGPLDDAQAVFNDHAQELPDGVDLVMVNDDPFGRGVEETGGELPVGAIDFGPTVRFYGDQYFGETTALPELINTDLAPQRYLSTGWKNDEEFRRAVLEPLAAGGSAVIVTGPATPERLDAIAEAERVDERLT